MAVEAKWKAASFDVLAAIGTGARAHSAILARTGLSATTVNETLLARLLPRGAERLTAPDMSGAHWNRSDKIEVDLVGGDERPVAELGISPVIQKHHGRTRASVGRSDYIPVPNVFRFCRAI